MNLWLALLVVIFSISYYLSSAFGTLIFGAFVGFICALVLHENKYVAIIANFIATKRAATDASSLYDKDILNVNLDTMWFNVGYWKNINPQKYVDGINPFILACQEMTALLASSVHVSDGDLILDVGSGCGEQDFYLAQKYPSINVVSIELSPFQVNYAKEKKDTSIPSIADRIHFEIGNAIELNATLNKTEVQQFLTKNHHSSQFDVVLALDCAYHFNLRTNFFQEAHKVLRVGGRIGLADVCLVDGVSMNNLNSLSRIALKWMLRRISIMPENLVDKATYKQKLENCGFREVTVTCITEHVFPGLLQFTKDVELRLGSVVKTHRVNKLRGVISFLQTIISRKLVDYVIVSGIKIEN